MPATMKFANQTMEDGFVSQRRTHLLERAAAASTLTVVIGVLSLVVLGLAQTFGSSATSLLERLHVAQFWSAGAMVIVLLFFRLALHCACLVERTSTFALESVVVFLLVAIMCGAVVTTPSRLCKIGGHTLVDLGEDFYDSDSQILMMIVGVVTGSHAGLPVRWCVMAPIELVAILLYAVTAFAIGSEEPPFARLWNLFFLVCLVVTAMLGKRASELEERLGFRRIIEERSRRCEAEFLVSQVGASAGVLDAAAASQPDSAPAASQPDSAPETCGSAVVFDPLLGGSAATVDVSQQLSRVVEVGRAEHWTVKSEHLTVFEERLLGRGGFGAVYAGVFCGMLVAVKRPLRRLENDDLHTFGDVCNELRVMRYLRHPNIVTTYGAVVLPQRREIALVLELIDGVMLRELVQPSAAGAGLGTLARYQIMLGVCQALLYMHSRSPCVVHGDLKDSNVMVRLTGGEAQPKLLDFGLSRVLARGARPLGGTLSWMAPEVLQRGPARCSADVYSFGLLVAVTATGVRPTLGMTRSEIRRALRRWEPPAPVWPAQCAFTPGCSAWAGACLSPAEDRRPDIRDIYERLLGLPEQRGLSELRGPFVDGVRLLATASSRGPPEDGAGEPAARAGAAEAAEPEPEVQDLGARGGLPALPEEALLAQDALESGSGALRRRAKLRPFPGMMETCSAAAEATFMEALKRWNYVVPGRFCCERHALAQMAAKICRDMSSAPCDFTRLHRPSEPAQCWNCGILFVNHDDAGACNLCGARPEGAPAEEEEDEEEQEEEEEEEEAGGKTACRSLPSALICRAEQMAL